MDNNVISLVDHIQKKKEVNTFNEFEYETIDHEKQKLSQRRIYSFMVDFGVICVLNAAINATYTVFISEFLLNLKLTAKTSLVTGSFWPQLSSFLVIYTNYFLYSLYIMDGQTLGKKMFGLTSVSDEYFFNETDTDETINLKQAFRRSLGYLACYLSFGSFFIFSIMSEDKRGLPDYLSGSRTVSIEWLNSTKAQRAQNGEIIEIDIYSLPKAA